MSLREKILIFLLIILGCYAGLEFFILKNYIAPKLIEQEQQQSSTDLYRCIKALENHLGRLQKDVNRLATSGALYAAIQSPANDTLKPIASKLNADFVFIYDINWANTCYSSKSPKPQDIEGLLFDSDQPFIKKDIIGISSKGLVYRNNHLYYITSAPITRSSLSKTVEGTVVAGQIVNDERLEALRKQLYLSFNWDLVDPDNLFGRNKDIVNRVGSQEAYDMLNLSEEYLQVSTVVYDYYLQPVLILKTFKTTKGAHQSIKTIQTALYTKIILGVVTVLLFTLVFQYIISKPIIRLIKYIISVANPGVEADMPPLAYKNELKTLSNEFEKMCRRLQQAQVKLMEKSFLSGVTEMSSGILHNVRNALSPITTRIERLKDQFCTIPLDNLGQAQSELQKTELNPQRRKDLIRFVELTFKDVLENLKDMVDGLDDLSQQVIEIEDMLSLQRTFGREDRPVEFIHPETLLNKAMEIVPSRIRKECRITIDSKIKKLPDVPVEPVTFIQVLQNILINAAESLEREKPLYPKINIQINIETAEDRQMLHWEIEDNGAGITADRVRQIFDRGASSKRQGLTGIGLHWCANTITAMKGAIWAESAGSHKGATLHLMVPMAPEETLEEETLLEVTKGQTE